MPSLVGRQGPAEVEATSCAITSLAKRMNQAIWSSAACRLFSVARRACFVFWEVQQEHSILELATCFSDLKLTAYNLRLETPFSNAGEEASGVERIGRIELVLDGLHQRQRIAGRSPRIECRHLCGRVQSDE